MDIATLTSLIGSLGFPIVVSGALFWYIVKSQREMRDAVDNNTKVMLKLIEHMDSDSYVP